VSLIRLSVVSLLNKNLKVSWKTHFAWEISILEVDQYHRRISMSFISTMYFHIRTLQLLRLVLHSSHRCSEYSCKITKLLRLHRSFCHLWQQEVAKLITIITKRKKITIFLTPSNRGMIRSLKWWTFKILLRESTLKGTKMQTIWIINSIVPLVCNLMDYHT